MEADLQTSTYDHARLQIIGVGEKDIPFGPDMVKHAVSQLLAGWMKTLPQLVQGRGGWPAPHALHMDYIAGGYVTLAWNESEVHSGRIVKHPGTPDMYDYERLAYGSPPTEGLAQLLVAAQGLARVVDGFIMPAARCMEPVGVPHCRALDQKSGQELFTVRSGAHEVAWNDAPPTPPTNAVVKAFVEALIATVNSFPNGRKDTDLG
ncbi:hypothetical protein FB451DRAFT_1434287 [Mycena latifolia]|nr:hypothetical protein FB451DRAFT_1416567 [Mycena latifolia]KAJ7444438.1 hypothetical protein FB451DRAFT_1434287 [Mycena latifolia]